MIFMLANKNVGDTQMLLKILLAGVLGIALVFGVGACGKRGDPYRPSEIPAQDPKKT